MFVLSRKPGEIVKCGDVTVTVIAIRGNKVRLGFDGPPHVVIDRKEVAEAKAREYEEGRRRE